MGINEIIEFILSEWQYFLGPISIVAIAGALKKIYDKKRKEKRDYSSEFWRLIKPNKKIKKKDFNVTKYNRLIKRPSESELSKSLLENKKNVLLVGGNEPNLKYGKSTLIYSLLKKKQFKNYSVFIPNLSTQIKSEDEIKIPAKWLQNKKRQHILLVEDLSNYKDNINSLIIYYNLLSKKSTELILIITTDSDFDIDWGNVELSLQKIKLSPIDKINDKDSIKINKIKKHYDKLEPLSIKILSYLFLYERLGLKTYKEYIYNVLSYENLDITLNNLSEKLLTLEATGFIIWRGEEMRLKKSTINPDLSNYQLIGVKNEINIKAIVNYFIHIKNISGLLHFSNVYNDINDFHNSKKVLNEIIKYKPKHHKAKFLLGQTYLEEYKFIIKEKKAYKVDLLDSALNWYEKACEENSNFYKYKLSLAYCLIKRGQSPENSQILKRDYFDKALATIDKTKNSINLDDYSFNYAYAFFYKKLKNFHLSLNYYKKLVLLNYNQFNYKLFTEYAELLLLINKSDLKLNYVEEIEKYLLISLNINQKTYYKTNDILALFYDWRSRDPKITIEEKNKYKTLAIDNFEFAFQKSDKKYIHALKGKAKVMISINRNDEAIDIFKNILSIDPNDFYCLRSIGTAYTKKRNIKMAISYYIKSLDKSIELKYIKTLQEIKTRKYPKLFKELSSISSNEEFIKFLKFAKEESINLLTKEFIELEIGYTEIIIIKSQIDKMMDYNPIIESELNAIQNSELSNFKNKTLALYYVKSGDIEKKNEIKINLYNKAKNILLDTYQKRRKKPQSYYKHLIVISSKISLIDGNQDYDSNIEKFEKQIKYADLTYAEIHFEFAKYLEELLKINYNYSSNLLKCIQQFEFAYEKFSLNSYSYKEIEYCEKRLIDLKSTPNNVYN